MLDLQEMPLVEPTNLLFNKMIANSIDGLLLQVTDLPRVHKSTILPSTLVILACEIGTHRLNQPSGEDVRSLHVRLIEENIPMSLTLRLEESAAAEERRGFFIRWSVGGALSFPLLGGKVESRFGASARQEFWVLALDAPS